MTRLKPKDMIAVFVLMCFTFLLFNGYDGPLTDFIGLMVGYYFGHRQQGVDSGH